MMKRFLVVGLTWVVPGAGHLLLGNAKKAIYFFVLLQVSFLIGLALGGFRIVSFEDYPFYTLVFHLNAGAAFAALKTTESLRLTREILTLELGCLFAAVASLLNILVMIDAYEIEENQRRRKASRPTGTAPSDSPPLLPPSEARSESGADLGERSLDPALTTPLPQDGEGRP